MSEEMLKGYLAYWSDYDSIHDIPNMWIKDPVMLTSKLNHELAAGWNAAAYECMSGEYKDFVVTPMGIKIVH